MALTRDEFLALPIKIKLVKLGDKEIYIRELMGIEFDRLRKEMRDRHGKVSEQEMMARFVVACACEQDGKPLFTGVDLQAVNRKGMSILMPVFRDIQDLNGLVDDDTDELIKNSETTTPNSSGTD